MCPTQNDSEYGTMKPASFFLKTKIWKTGKYSHVITIPIYKVNELGLKKGDELDIMVRVSKKEKR